MEEINNEEEPMTLDKDFEWYPYSNCLRCLHFSLETNRPNYHTCKAFPQGIPYEIWSGENEHKKPYTGDKGIQFEPK